MKTLAHKINIEANRIAREYVQILESGKEPATLGSIIQATRYGILGAINDARANSSDTLEKVRVSAHYNIKRDLESRPELAQRLIDFRKARTERDNQEAIAEQRNWRSFPSMA
jgi:hypothetical protein